MLPLYVRNVLHLGPDRMGMLMGISAIGSLSGSIGLLSVARELRFKFMTAAAIFVAVALFFLSRSNSFLLTACCMGTLAIGLSLNFGLAGTIVQERSPGPVARPGLGHLRPELFRINADRGFVDHRVVRLDRDEDGACRGCGSFRDRRGVRPERGWANGLRMSGDSGAGS